jgi:hypothetical protein
MNRILRVCVIMHNMVYIYFYNLLRALEFRGCITMVEQMFRLSKKNVIVRTATTQLMVSHKMPRTQTENLLTAAKLNG